MSWMNNNKPQVWSTSPELWEKLKPLARQKRKEPTHAENLLWQHLRNRKLRGFKFRRQHSIERFIVDFYCAEGGLVLEVDGPIHDYQPEEDKIRERFLRNQNLWGLRFKNEEVLNNLDEVLNQISLVLNNTETNPRF